MKREPKWVDFESIAARNRGYEEQLDANAAIGSAAEWRHRKIAHTGETEPAWAPGRAPN